MNINQFITTVADDVYFEQKDKLASRPKFIPCLKEFVACILNKSNECNLYSHDWQSIIYDRTPLYCKKIKQYLKKCFRKYFTQNTIKNTEISFYKVLQSLSVRDLCDFYFSNRNPRYVY